MIASIFLMFYLFILRKRERERERKCMWAEEGQRERIPSRLHAVSAEPQAGLDLTTCEIMPWAEIKSRMLNQLSYPGTTVMIFFFF